MKKDEPTFTFSNYLASEQDIAMVTSTLSEFFSTDLMADIFFDKSKIEDTLVISYDSKSLYVWHKGKDWSYETFDHDLSIDDASHKGWRTNLRPIELRSYLPKQWQDYSYKVPKISGCFVTPFTTLGRFPYNSESSYKSTIIHELGHVIFNKYVSHAYLNKEKNLVYIDAAITVLKDGNNQATLNSITLDFPTRFQVG